MCSKNGHFDVLIVDDEKRFAKMLAKRLALRGHLCEIAYDGLSALQLVDQKVFRLVILDLRLPDFNGTEILAKLQKTFPQLPVVILTGHGTDKDRDACLALGAREFFNKPADVARLATLLE